MHNAYNIARLEAEYPGWCVDAGDFVDIDENVDNPTLDALLALAEARKIAPNAYLVKIRRQGGYEYLDAVCAEAIPGHEHLGACYRFID